MTPRERFIAALERRPLQGRVPHFELVFFLTMECFGKVHPCHRAYGQWDQMQESERQLHRQDMARLYIDTAERFEHSAIFIHNTPGGADGLVRMAETIRRLSGDRFFLMAHGDATYGIPDGSAMVGFSNRIADDPQGLIDEGAYRVDQALAFGRQVRSAGVLDGWALCSDYCLNQGPFLSPRHFRRFVTPHLKLLVSAYREQGYYVIKHTDGNIMPILDQLVECGPHALHSIDPQAGVDLREVKRLYGDRVCLIGNVNCGLLDSGSDAEADASVRYALEHGMPGGGFIFSTSNCIYTGMRLERYQRMLDLWRRLGNYPQTAAA